MPSVYVITDPCLDVKDRSCVVVCPVDAIHTGDDDRICHIDPGACTGCNLCLPACPVGAIFTEETVPATAAGFIEANARWFSDPAAARDLVEQLARR